MVQARAEVSPTRVARLTVFVLPVALAFAKERGNLAASSGSAEGADSRGADLTLASHIRRNGDLTALRPPCAHVHQSTSYPRRAQAYERAIMIALHPRRGGRSTLNDVVTCGLHVWSYGSVTSVGIRELRARLSSYVRRVRRGEVIRVTDRGEVVAELCPPSSARSVPVELAGLHELASRGVLRLGKSNRGMRYLRSPVRLPEGMAKTTLDAEREDAGSERFLTPRN